jgi:hypothetical protein
MPRNVEDIVPPKRTIRDIPLPDNRKRGSIREPLDVTPPTPPPTLPPIEHPLAKPREGYSYDAPAPSHKKIFMWIGIVLVVIILGLTAFSLFGGATLNYTPRTANLTFDKNTFSAVKSADAASGKLLYSVVQIPGDKSAQAPATGQTQVSQKAQGTIIVYNNGGTPQQLVATTRFETSEGKIYRITSGITVPSKGNVEATVVADKAGPEYNIGLTDFTIPGLKGTPQFTNVYARSKTSLAGGFVGVQGKISASDMVQAKTLLDGALKTDLITKAQAQVPADYILFPNLSQINYDPLTTGSSTDTTASVTEHANFIGVIFKKSDLALYLATQKLDTPPTSPVEITDWNGLNVSASTSKLDLLNSTTITFQVSGAAPLLWVTDDKALASDLAGKSKSELSTILKNYPSVESANAMIRPFWKSAFPIDPGKIKIQANAAK